MAFQRNAGRRHEAPSTPENQAPAPRGFLTGAAARARSEENLGQQLQQVENRAQGLDLRSINYDRFRIPKNSNQPEADIIILDATLEDGVYFADEHGLQDSNGRWGVFEFCPKQHDHCPLCDQGEYSTYTLFLTVLDLRGRTDDTTQVHIPHVKRLMAVKQQLHPVFFKLHDACIREHGTMRGMQLLMARDGSVNSAIGVPVMLPSGKMFDWISEEDLVAEFGHAEVRDPDRNNVLLKAENYDITPFPYSRLFVPVTGEQLRARYGSGTSAPAGSRDDLRQEFQGAEHRANQGQTRVRTRSQVGGGFRAEQVHSPEQDPVPETRTTPPATLPPRTRSRTAPAGAAPASSGPVQPGAPRARTRTAAPSQPTTSRSRGGVPTDIEDPSVPI